MDVIHTHSKNELSFFSVSLILCSLCFYIYRISLSDSSIDLSYLFLFFFMYRRGNKSLQLIAQLHWTYPAGLEKVTAVFGALYFSFYCASLATSTVFFLSFFAYRGQSQRRGGRHAEPRIKTPAVVRVWLYGTAIKIYARYASEIKKRIGNLTL